MSDISQEELDHIVGAVKAAETMEEMMEERMQVALKMFQTAQDMKMVWIERAAKRFGIPVTRYFDDEAQDIYLCWSTVDTNEVVMDDETNQPLKLVNDIEDLLGLRVSPGEFVDSVKEANA